MGWRGWRLLDCLKNDILAPMGAHFGCLECYLGDSGWMHVDLHESEWIYVNLGSSRPEGAAPLRRLERS